MAQRGGYRPGAGRKKLSVERERHFLSATAEEWTVIKAVADLVREDRANYSVIMQTVESARQEDDGSKEAEECDT